MENGQSEAYNIAKNIIKKYSENFEIVFEENSKKFDGPAKLFKKIQQTEFKAPYDKVLPLQLKLKFNLLDFYFNTFRTEVEGLKDKDDLLFAYAYSEALKTTKSIETMMNEPDAINPLQRFTGIKNKIFKILDNASNFFIETANQIKGNETIDELFSTHLTKNFTNDLRDIIFEFKYNSLSHLFECLDQYGKIIKTKKEKNSNLTA